MSFKNFFKETKSCQEERKKKYFPFEVTGEKVSIEIQLWHQGRM
jgi:hypothetical protein